MDLTEKVLAFQEGTWTWIELWRSMVLEIESYLDTRKLDHDEQTRFLQRFESRAISMAERFRYFGKTFRALLFTGVRFQLRNFYNERNKRQKHEKLAVEYAGHEYELAYRQPEGSLESFPESADTAFRRPSGLNSRQKRILIVALKNCHALDDRTVLNLAGKLGLSPRWLLNSRDLLREKSLRRQEKVADLRFRNKSRRAWELYTSQNQEEVQEIKRRSERVDKVIDKMNPYPHHTHIAEVIGIPKGSVDSCLHYVRQGFKTSLAQNESGATLSKP
jgi:hypothetical protein